MATIPSGGSVRRRINELQSALEAPPPPVASPKRDPSEDSLGSSPILSQSTTNPSSVAGGIKPDPLSHDVADGRTTPTANKSRSPYLGSESAVQRKGSSPSPRPVELSLTPVLEPLPPADLVKSPDEDQDRYSVATELSERFSTVQLKTPTHTAALRSDSVSTLRSGSVDRSPTSKRSPPPPTPVPKAGGMRELMLPRAINKANGTNNVMTKLNDDEVDISTGRRSFERPSPMTTSALNIKTEVSPTRQDSLKTPTVSNNAHRPVSPVSLASPGASSSKKPLAEGVDLLIARIDKTKEDPERNRRSLEGREKLKEGFERLHLSPTLLHAPNSPSRKLGGLAASNGAYTDEKIDWEFWGEVIANYEHVARTKSEQLASAIQKGIPTALRGMVWELMSASKDVELERVYASLLKESSQHEKAIMRDLGRTFPQHSFFMDGQGIGQENLFNVLKAYSLYDPEVGYCQGLAFIGAALLLNMPDEEAFCVLVRLMYSYGSRDMYLPEMPGLQLRLFQFDRLVEELIPVLHVHFLRQGVKSSMFCSQWFLTMFSYRFPLDLVFRIFDSVFGHGIEAIFAFSVVLLLKNEEQLLKLKFDQILEYMKGELFDIYKVSPEEGDIADRSNEGGPIYRADEFVQDAFTVKITPFMLDNFANEWNELRKAQNAHATEVDNLRTTNRAMTEKVRHLEAALSALNAEHCELVKQLVMSKIAKEDVESELVRYKLMYAEVMHDREDSMSSNRISSPSAASRVKSISSLSLSFPSFSRA